MTFASPEVELFITRGLRECDRVLAALDGLSREQANWRPVEGANSIAVLATHMPANIREVLLGVVMGQPVVRDREAEFESGDRDPEALQSSWVALRTEVIAAFEPLSSAALMTCGSIRGAAPSQCAKSCSWWRGTPPSTPARPNSRDSSCWRANGSRRRGRVRACPVRRLRSSGRCRGRSQATRRQDRGAFTPRSRR
ncbi:MAG: DinB family protein [Thermoflexaceae bacterium]|nr:DinB family protein [Thermoflexaceae bacterium]